MAPRAVRTLTPLNRIAAINERDFHARKLQSCLHEFRSEWIRHQETFDEAISQEMFALDERFFDATGERPPMILDKEFFSGLLDEMIEYTRMEGMGKHVIWPVSWEENWVTLHMDNREPAEIPSKFLLFDNCVEAMHENPILSPIITKIQMALLAIDTINTRLENNAEISNAR
jgi:hypothetical protein